MAQAKAVSLSEFTKTVQAAVKAAVQKHPKFKVDASQGVAFSYLVRGIPVQEELLKNVTIAETQAFANDIASHIGGVQTEALAEASASHPAGVFYCHGGHLILGIPPIEDLLLKE